jgi:hypothetical protein
LTPQPSAVRLPFWKYPKKSNIFFDPKLVKKSPK